MRAYSSVLMRLFLAAILAAGSLASPDAWAAAKKLAKKAPKAESAGGLAFSADQIKTLDRAISAGFGLFCWFDVAVEGPPCAKAKEDPPEWLRRGLPGMKDRVCWRTFSEAHLWAYLLHDYTAFLDAAKRGVRLRRTAEAAPATLQQLRDKLADELTVLDRANMRGSMSGRGAQLIGKFRFVLEKMDEALAGLKAGKGGAAKQAVLGVAWQAEELSAVFQGEPLNPYAAYGPLCPAEQKISETEVLSPEAELSHYSGMGRDFYEARKYDKAVSAYERALTAAEKLGDLRKQEQLHVNTALAQLGLQNYSTAVQSMDRALALIRARKNLLAETEVMRAFSAALGQAGFANESRYYEREAGRLAGQRQVAMDGFRRGQLSFKQGRFAEAKALFGEPARLVGHVPSWIHMGLCDLKLEDMDAAAASFTGAMGLAREQGDIEGQTLALLALAGIYEEKGDSAASLETFEALVRIGLAPESRRKLSADKRLKLDAERARHMRLLETLYNSTERWDRAIAAFDEFERAAAEAGSPNEAFLAQVHRARLLAASGRPEDAVEGFAAALKRFVQSPGAVDLGSFVFLYRSLFGVQPYWTPQIQGFVAVFNQRLGELKAARAKELAEGLEKARKAGDRAAELKALLAMASDAATEGGDSARVALKLYGRALEAARKAKNRDAEVEIQRRLGALHAELEEWDEAVERLESALTLALWEDGRTLREIDPSYSRVASTVRLGALAPDPAGSLLKELGYAYLSLGSPLAAIDFVEMSMIVEPRENRKMATLTEFAQRLAGAGLNIQSMTFLKRLQEEPRVQRSTRLRIAVLALLAGVQRKEGGLGEDWALENLETALALSRSRGLDPDAIPILLTLGDLRLRKGRTAEAVEAYETAIGLSEAFRASLTSESARLAFFEKDPSTFAAYHLAVGGLLAAASAEPGYLDRAFLAAEKVRSRVLLESLGGAGLAAAGPFKKEESALANRISLLVQKRLDNGWSAGDVVQFAVLQDRMERLSGDIRRQDPRYAALRYPQPSGLAVVAAALRPGEAMVSYKFDSASVGWAIVVRPDRPAVLVKLDGAALREAGLSAKPGDPGADAAADWRESGRRLGALVWEPVEPHLTGIEKVLVVPDMALWDVSWGMLESQGVLLVDKPYTVQVVPSGSVLVELRRAPRASEAQSLVAFSPFSSKSIKSVPGGAKVMDAVRRLFPAARVFLPPQATKAAALQHSGGSRHVLYYTNGLADETNPWLSSIFFTDKEGKEEALTVAEAMQLMDLTAADLVVLSACRTARGLRVRAEGVMGLTRGLLYAGARGVIATGWSGADAASADLVIGLYKGLQSGKEPAQALQQTQREVRRRTYRGKSGEHPFFWAGFQLYGDPGSGLRTGAAPKALPLDGRTSTLRQQLDAEFKKDSPDPAAILRLQQQIETEKAAVIK